MIHLYKMEVQETQYGNDIISLLPKLSEEKRIKAKKYMQKIDQMRCILGEMLLRYILWKHYEIAPNEISFQYNEYGKPFLSKHKEIHFSISHSGNYVLCGVSDSPIGVDVEGGSDKIISIAERFFSAKESEYIKSFSNYHRYDAFYKIWTLKESYIKCIGKGLQIPLDSFQFEIMQNNINLYVNGISNKGFTFSSVKINDTYHIALCIAGNHSNDAKINIRCLSFDELFQSRKYL